MDNSPTALFDSYEQDFKQIVQSISQKLDGDAKEERGGESSPSADVTLRNVAGGGLSSGTVWAARGTTQQRAVVLTFDPLLFRATESGAAEGRDGAGRGR